MGLLGGSFNPAHEGHLHLSERAFAALGLDHIWWLVSPRNPLKSMSELAPFDRRYRSAEAVARHPRVHVTDIEARIGSHYTYRTLSVLKQRFCETHFVWLMGADNLAGFTNWQNWEGILNIVPIAIVDRPHYSIRALTAWMAVKYRERHRKIGKRRTIAKAPLPAWTFITGPRHSASATSIRQSSHGTNGTVAF